jgi:DNA-binding GntR family transcriptional regulator
MTVDPDAPEPPYRQLAGLLRTEIESGQRPPRSRLPSINQLASDHNIATATVVKALRVLKDEGLIVGATGHGTFVAERS